jgi:hypothetical protein
MILWIGDYGGESCREKEERFSFQFFLFYFLKKKKKKDACHVINTFLIGKYSRVLPNTNHEFVEFEAQQIQW